MSQILILVEVYNSSSKGRFVYIDLMHFFKKIIKLKINITE